MFSKLGIQVNLHYEKLGSANDIFIKCNSINLHTYPFWAHMAITFCTITNIQHYGINQTPDFQGWCGVFLWIFKRSSYIKCWRWRCLYVSVYELPTSDLCTLEPGVNKLFTVTLFALVYLTELRHPLLYIFFYLFMSKD